MATLTVFSDSADGYVQSSSTVYSIARSGNSLSAVGNSGAVGQFFSTPTYGCQESFLSFDTSPLGAGAIISAVALSIWGSANNSVTDFTIEARLDDWGVTLTSGDYVAGDSLGTLTLLATFDTTGYSTSGYNTMTESGSDFQNNISKTGTTRLLLNSSRHKGNNTPTGLEYVQFYTSEASGTANDPKLVITYTTASPANLVLGAAAGVAIASATLSTKGLLAPSSAAGIATAAAIVQTPVLLVLDAVPGIAVATLEIYTPNPYVLLGVSAGLSSATLDIYTVAYFVINAAGVATAVAVVTRPIRNSYIIHGGVRVVHTRIHGAGRMNVRRIDGGVPS